MQATDRFASRLYELEGEPAPENTKASKLQMLTPADTFSHIASAAGWIQKYDESTQIINTQTRDPVTGPTQGDKAPELNGLGPAIDSTGH